MNYQESLTWLEQQVPKAVSLQFPGARGLERAKRLMSLLDDPQDQVPVIHIAGTSGKGSTAYLISMLLEAHGFKVGLSLSPYILDVRERFQVNNRLPDESIIAETITIVRHVVEHMDDPPTYFELVTAVAYQLFGAQKCDYVVMETGMGGTYDATNVVARSDKVAVITRIGFDHMSVLGNTLPEIASQKAGIIQPENLVVALTQSAAIQSVVTVRVREVEAKIVNVSPEIDSVEVDEHGTAFQLSLPDSTSGEVQAKIHLGLIGKHQAENATIALTVVNEIARRDTWQLDSSAIDQALSSAHLLARLDVIKRGDQTIVIDGAHNPQKMAALLDTIEHIFPTSKPCFLLAFKEGKEAASMIEQVLPYADDVILTTFATSQDSPIRSVAGDELRELVSQYPDAEIAVVDDSREALKQTLADDRPLVISGSLYFCATMYPLLRGATE